MQLFFDACAYAYICIANHFPDKFQACARTCLNSSIYITIMRMRSRDHDVDYTYASLDLCTTFACTMATRRRLQWHAPRARHGQNAIPTT